jgi:rhodanese-related sulfurtransferase
MEIANVSTISASELFAIQNQGSKIELFDVRTGMEYRSGHIPGAKLLTLDEISDESLNEQLGDAKQGDHAPIYITCQSGFRASAGCKGPIKPDVRSTPSCLPIIILSGQLSLRMGSQDYWKLFTLR